MAAVSPFAASNGRSRSQSQPSTVCCLRSLILDPSARNVPGIVETLHRAAWEPCGTSHGNKGEGALAAEGVAFAKNLGANSGEILSWIHRSFFVQEKTER